MISLYESILGDIDTNIDISDATVAALNANKEGSPLREMFNIPNLSWQENPFSIEGNNILTVNYDAQGGIYMWSDENTDIKSEIGKTINTINVIGLKSGSITIDDIKDIDKVFAPNIQITGIYNTMNILRDRYNTLNNLNITQVGTMYIYSKKSVTLNNVSINASHGNIYFTSVPYFKNVKLSHKGINIIIPSSRYSKYITHDIYLDNQFDELFEFGYKLNVNGRSTNIKNLSDIKKLLGGKFYEKEFDRWPYRLKPNVKITDFIDISQCPNIEFITISDNKMGIVLLSPQSQSWMSYFEDMLKPRHEFAVGEYSKDNIKNKIPTTADGWMVIIYKC